MNAMLLACDNSIEKLCEVLTSAGAARVDRFSDPHEAVNASSAGEYAVILLYPANGCEAAVKLSALFADKSSAGVVLLLRADCPDSVYASALEKGIFVLRPPYAKSRLLDACAHALAMHNRLLAAKAALDAARGKLEEIKLVNRAKTALMNYLNMSEPQAHRYIEKQAMDRRTTKAEIAKSILANYAV